MGDLQGIYSNWVSIDLQAIRNNIHYILDRCGVQVMAIVKANAYGHGAVPVAQAAIQAGATWCGIARVSEALELRQAGLDYPMLLLGYTPPGRYAEMVGHQVSMAAWDLEQMKGMSAAAASLNKTARIHLKVDTGMSRLGVRPEAALRLIRAAASFPNLLVEGLFTHFACADEADGAPTDAQEGLFQGLVDEVHTAGIRIPLIHAANSAASLTRPSTCFNCVRFGIAMYGLQPSAVCATPAGFRPALSWRSVLSQVKTLPPGRGVSYGHEYVTAREERIGTVPVGYADGFRRAPGNQVLVGGRKVPVVGRVTMDQIMVQLDAVPDASAGDEVVLLGEQGEASITAEEIAHRWGTINYEVTSGIAHRVPRVH